MVGTGGRKNEGGEGKKKINSLSTLPPEKGEGSSSAEKKKKNQKKKGTYYPEKGKKTRLREKKEITVLFPERK